MKRSIFLVIYRDDLKEICNFMYETCVELSKCHTVVAFLINETFSPKDVVHKKCWFISRQRRVFFVRPLMIFPFQRFGLIRNINVHFNLLIISLLLTLYRLVGESNRLYLWMFHPEDAGLFRYLRYFCHSIYDVVDYFSASEFRQRSSICVKELFLLQHVGVVSVISHSVFKYVRERRRQVALVPQGFRIQSFSHARRLTLPRKVGQLFHRVGSKPIVGFVGGLNYRLDYQLLYELVQLTRKCHFVFIGANRSDQNHAVFLDADSTQIWLTQLRQIDNVHIYDKAVPARYMPSIISRFDVCMIPYDIRQEFNLYSFPMKLMEYFYTGKPVISTPIDELKRFPGLVKLGRTPKEWERHITFLLEKTWSEKHKQRQKRVAERHTWTKKIGAIIQLLESNETSPQ